MKILKSLFLIGILFFFISAIYNFISGNKAPIFGHVIGYFRPVLNGYKVVNLEKVEHHKVAFKDLPEEVKKTLMDYKEDVNRPVSEKKFDYTSPYINLGTNYNLYYERSNFVYSNYHLFYLYGANYRAVFINHSYYINVTNYGSLIFYNDNIYIYNDKSGRFFTDENAIYSIVGFSKLIDL